MKITFAKAFDLLRHLIKYLTGDCCTLDHNGIRGSTHKWISSSLSERSQKVALDGQASDPDLVLSGVPQDRSFFSSSLMIFRIISGHLFASLRMIVCFIGI